MIPAQRVRGVFFVTLLLAAFFAVLFLQLARAGTLTFISDLISSSTPLDSASHRIQFTVATTIPPLGTITITPENGAFAIPSGYDFNSVTFSVWNGSSYVPRPLAAVADATSDGVSITGGSDPIVITLSSGADIPAGSKVRLTLAAFPNPSTDGSYRLLFKTQDSSGAVLDEAATMFAIVQPVTLTVPLSNVIPIVSNALPTSTVAAGNPTIEISFNTDWPSVCKYSLTPGTSYASMAFTMPQTNSTIFYKVLNGFQDGTTYTYYIRCLYNGGTIPSTVDYPLRFTLAPTPISNTSVAQPGGGTVGVGAFTNGSAVLYLANLTISGFSSPGSTVEILKDGTKVLAVQAQGTGAFQANVQGLERGTYTFAVYSTDASGRKSGTYTATMSINAGTNNTLNNILLSPSVSFATNPIGIGESSTMLGSAAPNSTIEVALLKQTGSSIVGPYVASSSVVGDWSTVAPKGDLTSGTYSVRARVTYNGNQSNYSAPVYLGVGQTATIPAGDKKGDLNGDGKVNLVDFSILLSQWGPGTGNADLNGDGAVNLADFSILLFNWTG